MFRNSKIEFSKKLLYFVMDLILVLFVLVIVSLFTGNTDALTALITGVFSLGSVAFGFYFWKAKNENIMKSIGKADKETIKKIETLYNAFYKGDNEDDEV